MSLAEQLFHKKRDVIRHVLRQLPEGEKPYAPAVAQQANDLVAKLPDEARSRLGKIITSNEVYDVLRTLKRSTDPNQRKKTVHWTEAEEEQLADLVTNMRLNNIHDGVLVLCRRAQEQLPAERRKTIGDVNHVARLLAKVQERLDNLKKDVERGQHEQKPAPPLPTAEDILKGFSDEALFYYVSRERKLPTSLLLPVIIEGLLQQVEDGRSVLQALVEAVNTQSRKLEQALDYARNRPTTVAVPNGNAGHKKLPRMAICGPLEGQFRELQQACKQYAELRFLNKDRGGALPFSADDDYTVLFINWIGHQHENQAIAAVGKDKVIRHAGGLARGIDLIIALAKQAEASKK